MRIYNAKNSLVDIPLPGSKVRVVIPAHSISQDVLPSDELFTMLATNYEASELALIVNGPFEVNLAAKSPAVTPMVVNSIDEAIKRFTEEDAKPELKIQPVAETPEPVEVPAPAVEEEKPEDKSVMNLNPAPEEDVKDEPEVPSFQEVNEVAGNVDVVEEAPAPTSEKPIERAKRKARRIKKG